MVTTVDDTTSPMIPSDLVQCAKVCLEALFELKEGLLQR
jgi:hypothetical protein